MTTRLQIGVIAAGVLAARAAHADHQMMTMEADGGGSQFGASVAVVGAQFSTIYYVGNYEGILPAASWAMGRFALGATIGVYRIDKNGLQTYGNGDLVAHGEVTILAQAAVRAGVSVAASDPIGAEDKGMGMGHPMLMSSAWGTWRHDRVALHASAGYSRAVMVPAGDHDHGPWPLVDPMNLSEVTWSLGGDVGLGHGMRAGGRATGGIPVGSRPGHDRVIGALRFAWDHGQVGTAAELQAGLVGDPFNIRAVLETALHF